MSWETVSAILLFLLGLGLIIKGGDVFVDAATWMAEASGIPKFIVGATVVSIATTLPEVFASSIAAAGGSTEIAIGNAIGSVTANTGLIMGVSVIFLPMAIKRAQIGVKAGMMLTTRSPADMSEQNTWWFAPDAPCVGTTSSGRIVR